MCDHTRTKSRPTVVASVTGVLVHVEEDSAELTSLGTDRCSHPVVSCLYLEKQLSVIRCSIRSGLRRPLSLTQHINAQVTRLLAILHPCLGPLFVHTVKQRSARKRRISEYALFGLCEILHHCISRREFLAEFCKRISLEYIHTASTHHAEASSPS
jgi:hypothetical protein